MRSLNNRIIILFIISLFLIIMIMPVSAAPAANIVNSAVNEADCYVDITIEVTGDASYYAINLWDDGSFRGGAGANMLQGQSLTVRFTIGGRIAQAVPGIGIYVDDAIGSAYTVTYASRGGNQFWSNAVADTCVGNGYVFGAVAFPPFPEITPEVTPEITPEITPVPPTPTVPMLTAMPTAQPLPLCALFGGGTNPIVRANANPYQFCRILVENSQYVQIGAEIGDVNLINLGVIQAVDIFEFTSGGQQVIHFSQPLTVCLQGVGFMYYRDATGQPRTTALLSSWQEGNYTCATISNAGTVVLTGRS